MSEGSRLPRSTVLIFYLGMTALALVWGWLRGEPGVFWIGAPRVALTGLPDEPWLAGLLLGTLVAVAAVLVSRLMHVYFRWARILAREMIRHLGPLSWFDVVYLAVLSGVGEELLFRGALQPHTGYVLASVIFGIVHVIPDRRFLPWTISAVVMGFVLGGLAELTGNLVAPITTHVLINLMNLGHLKQLGPLFGVGEDDSK